MFSRVALASLLAASSLNAQFPGADAGAEAAAAWIRLPAPPGAEEATGAMLAQILGLTWSVDRSGNLIRRLGSGTPVVV
jgi:hypothetical protein